MNSYIDLVGLSTSNKVKKHSFRLFGQRLQAIVVVIVDQFSITQLCNRYLKVHPCVDQI